MNEEYRIEIKVKNNLLIKKIEEAGYKTVGEFCRLNNMTNCTSTLGDIINMKRSPLRSDGQWQSIILKCSDILNCMPDDFFTHAHLTTILKTNTRSIQINEAEMKFMLENKHNLSFFNIIINFELPKINQNNQINFFNPKLSIYLFFVKSPKK